MREAEVLGHLLAVRWAPVRFTRHNMSPGFGIRFANDDPALEGKRPANAQPVESMSVIVTSSRREFGIC